MKILLVLLLSSVTVLSQQISYFNQGFLRQPSAAADRAYLDITNGGGAGTVTSFSSGSLTPLFNASVATPTTTPALSYSLISQSANLVFASPDGVAGVPSFRALTLSDLPSLPSGGSVTNFASGNLSPLFTTSVASSTTYPTQSFVLNSQAGNTVFAGSATGGVGVPTFRNLVPNDIPNISALVRGYFSGSAPVDYDSSMGNFSMHVADGSDDGYLSSTDWTRFNAATGTLTGVTNASPSLGVSLISNSNSPNPSFKSILSGSGTTVSDQGGTSIVVTATSTGTVVSITNAATSGVSLISNSNSPIPSLKSISAGANVTLTDNGGTNISIASSGGGGSSLTDFLQYQTNYLFTLRTLESDITEGGTTVFNGFGDTLGFSGSTGFGSITRHLITAAPPGLWCELRCPSSASGVAQLGTQTLLAVCPYTGYTLTYQTFLVVRNTNAVRIISGAMAVNLLTADAITNQIMFRYSTGSNDVTWHGVVSDGTNETVVDTGVGLTNDGLYYLAFTKTGTTVTFNVNHSNTVTASSSVPNNFNRTGEAMSVFYGIETLNSLTKTNLLRYIGYAEGWVTP